MLSAGSLISSIAWSSDGKHVALLFNYYGLDEKNQAHIWDVENEKKTHTIKHNQMIEYATWKPQGNCLAVGGRDGAITVLDIETNKMKKLSHKYPIATLAWTNNHYLISSDSSNQVKTWNISQNTLIKHEKLDAPTRSIIWNEKASCLITQLYHGPLSIQKPTTHTFSTDQLWLLLILKKAHEEGKTIIANG